MVKYVAGAGGTFRLTGSTVTGVPETDYVVSVSPPIRVLEVKGEEVTYTVSISGSPGFNSPVALSIAGALPAGTTARLSPTVVSPGGSSVLTITTSAATPGGRSPFTVQGTAGAAIRTATALLDAGAIWPRFQHDARGTGRSHYPGPQTDREAWVRYPGDAIASSPAIGADGAVYCGTRQGRLVALRGSDGKDLWKYDLPGRAAVDSSPAVGVDGTLYFGADDGWLYALSSGGELKWRLRLGATPVRSGPVIAPDGTVYVTAGGNLYAARPEGTLKWSFAGGGAQNGSPALGRDGTIYFGVGGGTANGLYAVRDTGAAGERKWLFATAGAVLSSPLVAPTGRICFGADGTGTEGRFYIVADGGAGATKIAEVSTGGPIQSSPALGPEGTLYVGCRDGNLYAFTADGRLKWRFPTRGAVVASPAVAANGTLYIGSRDQYLYALRDDGSAGAELWRGFAYKGVEASPAIGANGAL